MKIKNFESGSLMCPVICKIGGASLRNVESIRQLPSLIREYRPTSFVVSAMGGVTDRLDAVVDFLRDGKVEESKKAFATILFGHYQISRDLELKEKDFFVGIFHEFKTKLLKEGRGLTKQGELENFILATGEILSSHIIWKYLQKDFYSLQYADARDFIFLKGAGGHVIDREKTREALSRLVEKNQPFLIAGFIAAGNRNLGRNGSDTTLALIADAYKSLGGNLRAVYCKEHIFDMRKLKEAKSNLSYGQFRKAMAGKSQPYVHESAVAIFEEHGMPFEIRAKKDPNFRLTVSASKSVSSPPIKKAEERFAE